MEAKVVQKLQKCPSPLVSPTGCELLLTWETKPQIKRTRSSRVSVTQHSCIFHVFLLGAHGREAGPGS